MSEMHAYRPYIPVGNMAGKCSALTEHSVRGDRLLGCNRPASDPIHHTVATHNAAVLEAEAQRLGWR